MKSHVFILCSAIFLVRLLGKFEIDHTWNVLWLSSTAHTAVFSQDQRRREWPVVRVHGDALPHLHTLPRGKVSCFVRTRSDWWNDRLPDNSHKIPYIDNLRVIIQGWTSLVAHSCSIPKNKHTHSNLQKIQPSWTFPWKFVVYEFSGRVLVIL